VDQSDNMLDRAKKSLGGKNIDFRIGSLQHLPLRDGEVKLAVLSMVLHHVPDFINAIKEANRVTSDSGKLIISELKKHKFEEMRDNFADFYLGFDEGDLCEAVESCGYRVLKKEKGKGKGKLECIFIQAEKIRPAEN
ncbi:MAG: class I SAM-dependent methyltransferase, partial [Spirochaetia bacterium]|nr:class I SAM-dependent methyltransferase [Spirochaetia bacterium]